MVAGLFDVNIPHLAGFRHGARGRGEFIATTPVGTKTLREIRHMKITKILSAATLALLFTTAAHAENRIGVLAGINSNKFNLDIGSSDSKTGFVGGVFGQYDYNGNLFGEVQLRYNRKGGEITTLGSQASTGASWLEIPLYAKYKFGSERGFIPYVFAGPSIAFKVGSSSKVYTAATNTTVEGDGNFNGVDLGLDLGLGAEYPIYGDFNLSLSAAYNIGLLDVDSGASSANNRGLQVYAGVSLPY